MTDEILHELILGVRNLGGLSLLADLGEDETPEQVDEFTTELFGLIEDCLRPYAERITDPVDLMQILTSLLTLLQKAMELREMMHERLEPEIADDGRRP